MNIKLDAIKSPADLKKIPMADLPVLADQIRNNIIDVVSKNGGHLGASLGAVEIAIALHYILDTPKDKLIWDVGHQAYAHKLLTGRYGRFGTIRQLGGLSGFPNKDESIYDPFTVGHSSTSISQGLGLACGRDAKGESYNIVSVIGDASLAGGLAFEAINNAGHMNKNIMIILNDNELSIAKTVGAMSRYLNRIMTNPVYNKVRGDMQKVVKRIPIFGFKAYRAARKLEEGLKNLIVPGYIFEELGVRYFGPIDGHDIGLMVKTFKSVLSFNEPRIVHVITKKGKGYKFAEDNPSDFHGLASFDPDTGAPICAKPSDPKKHSFSDVFGCKITELADKDSKIVAISAAMRDGTGLTAFANKYPDRFFDVGIAEEHAVTFAGALARSGMKPVVAVYSTFLQRAYDQIIHDVALQNLPVIFAVDRAGLVGEDGPTHHGVFDMAFLRSIPNIIVMAPRDGFELEQMLEFAIALEKPVAIRYPRGSSYSHIPAGTFSPLKLGKSEVIRRGRHIAIIAIGSMVSNAVKIADILSDMGVESEVINARFVKPLDIEMLENIAGKFKKIVTIEEGISDGGFGSAILEAIERNNIKGVAVKRIGLPDEFIEHGKREELFKKYHLTADEVAQNIFTDFIKR